MSHIITRNTKRIGISCPNSVCLSVRHRRALWQKTNDALRMCWYHPKGQSLRYWYQQWLVVDAPSRLQFAFKVTHPSSITRRLRQIFAYNVSVVRDNEKIQLAYDELTSVKVPHYQCNTKMGFKFLYTFAFVSCGNHRASEHRDRRTATGCSV